VVSARERMPSARSSLLAGVSIRRNQCRRLLVENAEFVDVTENSAVELTRDRAGQRWRARHREILSRMVRETEPPTDSLPRITNPERTEHDDSIAIRARKGCNRARPRPLLSRSLAEEEDHGHHHGHAH
jgi:hypothetical protein